MSALVAAKALAELAVLVAAWFFLFVLLPQQQEGEVLVLGKLHRAGFANQAVSAGEKRLGWVGDKDAAQGLRRQDQSARTDRWRSPG